MLFKDNYNGAYTNDLALYLSQLTTSFNPAYLEETKTFLPDLEMRDRVNIISDALYNGFEDLENDVISKILIELAFKDEGGWRGFFIWPIISVFERHFVKDFELAMKAFYAITPLFTAEFAIRPFILHYPEDVFNRLAQWACDDNEHVRRLASEGIRTKLPWGCKVPYLNENPQKILAILDKLKEDESLYVRRSVANNLNDLAKDYPELVFDFLENWKTDTKERKWLVKHALRTLVKKGEPRALALIGVDTQFNVVASAVHLSQNKLNLGEDFMMSLTLNNQDNKDVQLVLDYVIHHVKANGQTSPKIFKWKNITLKASEEVQLQKKHKIYPVTTRRYYSGVHKLDIMLNGKVMATESFELKVKNP